MQKPKENFGDLLGKYLVEKISHKKVVFTHPNKHKWKHKLSSKPIYITAGSILAHVNKYCVVWGSGIINTNQLVKPARFLSVRGPQTRRCLLEQGYAVPEKYGDPALLLPKYYHPEIEKRYKLGIIPHYTDYKGVIEQYTDKNIKIIDLMTNSVEDTTREILACEHIVSSSLHGLIVAHAYRIPAVWIKFSDKLFGDDIKFQDYFESVGIKLYPPLKEIDSLTSIDFKSGHALPKPAELEKRKQDLLETCPFK
ncbi:polysaccharide pyruvyl transferase family protein [Psychroflexus sp. YR1-1]|uniref:Polysaccharide pyruvyl transferase family protein n=1 Tax=Psychroflexus aurantiacus TaxID=2709310 RepID=A0A6B3R095_9FLAO|nr:polysaccharide pyruvyl transferase family protein [Psychroflexus aurantiacus]NEV93939.1 polysaccharide pyruvyl transferase family protein [Psychroflexus aurantiacus]